MGNETNTAELGMATPTRIGERYPAGPIHEPSPPLSESERRKILFDWNRTWTPYPRDLCFHQLFQAQVARSPQAVAVESRDECLTYEQLEVRANQLAGHLQNLGVGPEVLVGVHLEASANLLVALLAILKAGGAYVPLDPGYPGERLAFMIQDSGMKVFLRHGAIEANLPLANVLVVDLAAPLPKRESIAKLTSAVGPDNLAYVIYTSGSTGKPKGVMVPHRALVNYLVWAVQAYGVQAGVGAPVHSSISFDLTITGLFAPLLAGRCVYLLPSEQGLETLANALRRNENFSLVKITPAHLEMLCAQLNKDEASAATRSFIVGGEALFARSLGFWKNCAPDAVLVNEYGPTETVVGCCVYFVPKNNRAEGAIPIGRPIANTQLYVLDARGEPVPIGRAGELHIAGDGLARGYLNRPELTAQAFVPNPFAAEDPNTSGTMYKTGDLVRYRPDGNLEYFGRIDDQIKIRGYRIEPSEIEAALLEHPGVRQAAVAVRSNAAEDKYLAAYFVPEPDAMPPPAKLREHLLERLPEYMIPAVFLRLSGLPLTANGKVNRPALPAPEAETQFSYLAPRTRTERKLAEIWQTVFQRETIGLHDSFFEMGGHSLLAVRLVSQINDIFETDLDAITLMEHPTVETLSQALHSRELESQEAKIIPMRDGGSGAPIFFLNTPFDFIKLASQTEEHPVFTSHVPWSRALLQASARLEFRSLPSVGEMAAPHAVMINKSLGRDPCVVAGYSYGGILAFEVAHQLQASGQKVKGVILFDADIKMKDWQRIKRRVRRNLDGMLEQGVGYLVRKANGRIRRGQEQREIDRATLDRAATNDLSTEEGVWEAVDRIWRCALRRYRLRPLGSRGVLLRAQETFYDSSQDYDGCLGWSRLFSGGLDVIRVPGDHHSMWKEPHIETLTRAWLSSLGKLRGKAEAALCLTPTMLAALACGL